MCQLVPRGVANRGAPEHRPARGRRVPRRLLLLDHKLDEVYAVTDRATALSERAYSPLGQDCRNPPRRSGGNCWGCRPESTGTTPTRGVDLGAEKEIHRTVRSFVRDPKVAPAWYRATRWSSFTTAPATAPPHEPSEIQPGDLWRLRCARSGSVSPHQRGRRRPPNRAQLTGQASIVATLKSAYLRI